MMRKRNYAVIVAVLFLAGCQSENVTVETKEVMESEVEAETGEAVIGVEAEAESDSEEEHIGQENPYIHVALTRNYESEWSDEYRKLILKAESDNVHVLNEGYDHLNTALEQYNQENFHELLGIYEESLSWAREMAEEGNPEEWFLTRNVDVVRSDETILSFWNTQTDYLGGAHGGYYSSGVNFDPVTGKQLELRDVVTDYEAFYQMVLDNLKENYEEETFFEGWQECLDEMFLSETEDAVYALEWTMDEEGVTICMNPYAISSWAAGVMEVKIPFVSNEEMFLSEYICEKTGNVQRLLPGERYALSLDTNGNGVEELVSFSYTEDGNTFQNQLQIMKEEGDLHTSREVELYGLFSKAYMIETEEGHPYLYVELKRENDYCLLEVFDMGEKFCHVGTSEASLYENPIINMNGFPLYRRMYILGTYMMYQEYHLGEDGMPITNDKVFYMPDLGGDYVFELISTRKIPVQMHTDHGKQDEILPVGTVFVVKKTDGETFVEMELSDGRRCDILLEKDVENFGFLIDGINEFECFELIPYAG